MNSSGAHLSTLSLRFVKYIDARSASRKFKPMLVPFHACWREPQDPEKASRRLGIVLANRNEVEVEARDNLARTSFRLPLKPSE
jgi:hypothetical protein